MSTPTSPARGNVLVTGAILMVLLALGMLLGIYGALLSARGPRTFHHVFSLGVLIAVVGNVAAAIVGRLAAGRFGGITPLVGWLLVAYAFSISRPNGSVLLPGGDLAVPSVLFQVLGALAGAAAGVLKPPRRWRRGAEPV